MADIHTRGPIFDGRAIRSVRAFAEDAEREVAEMGVDVVRAELSRVLRHPTGYYQSQLQTDRRAGDSVINDGGVVYGPWLEGTGSRNAPVTSFEGYATFRRMAPRIEARASTVVARVFRRHARGLE